MKKLKFVIVTIYGLGGGVIVTHALCKYLRELGYDAKVIYPKTGRYCNNKKVPYNRPYWFVSLRYSFRLWREKHNLIKNQTENERQKFKYFPVKNYKRKYLPFINKNTVVIYPETTYGNPLHADKVVRWLLSNRWQDSSDDGKYGDNDLFFCYRPVFNDYKRNPDCRTLRVVSYDLETYKRTNYGERKGKCYIIRKGKNRSDLPKEFDGPIIDDLDEKEKVKILNECEYCISYDTQTGYSGVAAICGCISIIVPEQGKTRKDYLKEGDEGYGRAYGFSEEELKYAVETQDKILSWYQELNESAKEEVERFAHICEEYFANKKGE